MIFCDVCLQMITLNHAVEVGPELLCISCADDHYDRLADQEKENKDMINSVLERNTNGIQR